MLLGLMGLVVFFSIVRLASFLRPPRIAVLDGRFAFRFGFRSFQCPAENVAERLAAQPLLAADTS